MGVARMISGTVLGQRLGVSGRGGTGQSVPIYVPLSRLPKWPCGQRSRLHPVCSRGNSYTKLGGQRTYKPLVSMGFETW
jgi:hypothetical protein